MRCGWLISLGSVFCVMFSAPSHGQLEVTEELVSRAMGDYIGLRAPRRAEGVDTTIYDGLAGQAQTAQGLGDYDEAWDLLLDAIDGLQRTSTASGIQIQIPGITWATAANPGGVTQVLTDGKAALGFSSDGHLQTIDGVAGPYEGGFFARDMFAPGQPTDIFTGTIVSTGPGTWQFTGASTALALDLVVDIEADAAGHFTFDAHVTSQTAVDRGILLALKLPYAAAEWHEDLRVTRAIGDPIVYENVREWKSDDPTGRYVSMHPLGAVDDLALAIPLYPPRIFRIGYTPADSFFGITYELGLADTQNFDYDASCTFHLFRFHDREGLRSAVRAYHAFDLAGDDVGGVPAEPLEFKGILTQTYSTVHEDLERYQQVQMGYLLHGNPEIVLAKQYGLWNLKYNNSRIPLTNEFRRPDGYPLTIPEIEATLASWVGNQEWYPAMRITLGDLTKDEYALAMDLSWAKNTLGEHFLSNPGPAGGRLIQFADPSLANGIWNLQLHRSILPAIVEMESLLQPKHALFQDVTNDEYVRPNAHPDHLDLVSHPLVFDHSQNLLYTLPVFDLIEFHRHIRVTAQEHIFINTSPFPHHSMFLAPACSSIGTEILPADGQLNLWRVVADGKLIGSTLVSVTRWIDSGQLGAFWGAFLVPANSGSTPVLDDLELNVSEASLYYDEIVRLNEIGWNAETHAHTLEPNLWIESWGGVVDGNFTVTLRNQHVQQGISSAVTIDFVHAGMPGNFKLRDRITGALIRAVQPGGPGTQPQFPVTLGAGSTRVLELVSSLAFKPRGTPSGSTVLKR